MASRSCELACWREASGIADPPGPSDEECSAARCRERAPCPQLRERRHRPLLTHVVVAASRFGAFPRANKTLDRVREIVRNQADVRRRVLPANSSLVLFVDNDTPSPAGEVMRAECEKQGLLYERNGDWRFGHQYELGAWRWAVLKVLPTLGLSADTIIYLMQVAPRGTRTRVSARRPSDSSPWCAGLGDTAALAAALPASRLLPRGDAPLFPRCVTAPQAPTRGPPIVSTVSGRRPRQMVVTAAHRITLSRWQPCVQHARHRTHARGAGPSRARLSPTRSALAPPLRSPPLSNLVNG